MWLCPGCETENDDVNSVCSVCKSSKSEKKISLPPHDKTAWKRLKIAASGFVFVVIVILGVRGCLTDMRSETPAAATPAAAPKPAAAPDPASTAVPSGFVRISGGTFMMGSPASEPGRDDDEGPQHRVTVSSFYMGKYEVTVGDFRRFVNATGYKTTAETSGGGFVWSGGKWVQKSDASWRNPYFPQNDNHPVVEVSWYDAVAYCNWLSGQEGLSLAYTRTSTTSGYNVTWNRSADRVLRGGSGWAAAGGAPWLSAGAPKFPAVAGQA
jgi:formylglycine-generating enzyme required for sulfatase activity